MLTSFRDLFVYRDLLRNLILREVRLRYRGSALGILWSFVTPLVMFLVYYLVFSLLTKQFQMEHYEVFLLSGLLAWMFFQSSIAKATPSIRANAMLVRMVYFPRIALPISTITGEFVFFLSALVVLTIVSTAVRQAVPIGILALPAVLPAHFMLALGFGLIFATLSVFYRDTEQVVNLVLTVWFFASPVFYKSQTVLDKLPELSVKFSGWFGPGGGQWLGHAFERVYFLNPAVYFLRCYNTIFHDGGIPAGSDILNAYIGGLIVLAIGAWVFTKYQGAFAEEL